MHFLPPPSPHSETRSGKQGKTKIEGGHPYFLPPQVGKYLYGNLGMEIHVGPTFGNIGPLCRLLLLLFLSPHLIHSLSQVGCLQTSRFGAGGQKDVEQCSVS